MRTYELPVVHRQTSGCCAARTITAPLDRAKLLLQTGGGLQSGTLRAAARQGVWPALMAIGREEGWRGYWKGNMPQARAC